MGQMMNVANKFRLTEMEASIRCFRIGAIIVTALGLSTQMGKVEANSLDSLMGQMYINASSAGYFDAQQRGVISGGSLVARVPIKPINIASFDPPRVSGGCGGINLFGGAFSFINAKELTALLRTIAQNALGLLFNIGINAISQPLSAMLSSWQKKLQDMTNALKNSCEAARKLFTIDRSGDSIKSEYESFKGVVSSSWGETKDYFSHVQDNFTNGWKELRPSDDPRATAPEKAMQTAPNVGNVVYSALIKSGSAETMIPNELKGDPTALYETRMLLMNLTGTQIFNVNNKPVDTTSKDSQCTQAGKCENKPKTVNGVLMFDDLIAPNPNNYQYSVCKADKVQVGDPNSCNEITNGRISDFYKGVRAKINKMFYGVETSEVLSNDRIVSIINDGKAGIVAKSMSANGSQSLTDEEKQFLANTQFSATTYYTQLANHPDLAAALSEKVRAVLERKQAISLANDLLSVSQGIYNSNNVTTAKPPEFDENIKKFAAQVATAKSMPALEFKDEVDLNVYATMVISSLMKNGVTYQSSR